MLAATSGDGDSDVVDRPNPTVPDDRPDPEAEIAPEPAGDPEVADPAPDPETEIVDDARGGDGGEPRDIPLVMQTIEAGAYTADLLGGTLTFELAQDFELVTATTNRLLMIDAPEPLVTVGARAISFSRISGWNTPEESVDQLFAQLKKLQTEMKDPLDLGKRENYVAAR